MSTCPCCGSTMKRVPVDALRFLRASRAEVAVISILADAYPMWVPTSVIADRVYADDPNGGPLYADKSVAVRLNRLKGRLADLGWRTKGMMGRNSQGVRLEPLEGRPS